MNTEKALKFYKDHRLKVLTAVLVLSVVGMHFYTNYQKTVEERKVMDNASEHGCTLEYGKSVCVENSLRTAFFNPSNHSVTYVEISVPVNSGTNVYKVTDPLPSNETGTLTTASCSDRKSGDLELEWCCESKCFETPMVNPSDDLEIKKTR